MIFLQSFKRKEVLFLNFKFFIKFKSLWKVWDVLLAVLTDKKAFNFNVQQKVMQMVKLSTVDYKFCLDPMNKKKRVRSAEQNVTCGPLSRVTQYHLVWYMPNYIRASQPKVSWNIHDNHSKIWAN